LLLKYSIKLFSSAVDVVIYCVQTCTFQSLYEWK